MTLIGKNVQRWMTTILMTVVALTNVVPAAAQLALTYKLFVILVAAGLSIGQFVLTNAAAAGVINYESRGSISLNSGPNPLGIAGSQFLLRAAVESNAADTPFNCCATDFPTIRTLLTITSGVSSQTYQSTQNHIIRIVRDTIQQTDRLLISGTFTINESVLSMATWHTYPIGAFGDPTVSVFDLSPPYPLSGPGDTSFSNMFDQSSSTSYNLVGVSLDVFQTDLDVWQVAYVPNQGSNNVSVIDTSTNTEVLPRIPVGSQPLGVALTPDGAFAYVTNSNSHNVSVINTSTNTEVLPRIPVGFYPFGAAFTPDGAFAYVVNIAPNSSGNPEPSNVSVINASTNTEVLPRIPVGTSPFTVAITPDGAVAYVVNFWSHDITVIDTSTNTEVLPRIPVGMNPFAVAFTPDGAFAYVTNYSHHNVSVINTSTNQVLSTIPVGANPGGVAITPDGAFAYVANSISNDVSVIDTSTNTEMLPRIPVGNTPTAVAIRPDGAFAYVANYNSNDVSVIDTSTNIEVLPRIPVGTSPRGVAITPATPAATSTLFASSLNPSRFGQIVTFTATVTSAAAGTPTGTVTFKDGATSLGAVTLNASGQASLSTTALSVGTHTITAVYGGSLNFATSTSGSLTQTVIRAPTNTTLASSSNPSASGQAVSFTATVSGAGGLPTGTVTFLDGNTTIGSGTLNSSGQTTFSTSALTTGSHNIKAAYGGDVNFAGSNSGNLKQTVQSIITSTTLSSSLNPSSVGQAVTFTAQVTSSSSAIPTGTVTFKDSGKTLGTGTLNASGQASFTTSSLKKGSRKITAVYGGNATFPTSTSATLTQLVQ
jgi:YVTN family beta-propeller protein